MKALKKLSSGIGTAWELIVNVWRGPNWWIVPVVIILLPLALIFVLLNTAPLVAPFVYTIL